MTQTARRHHFVPKFLMRPWVRLNAKGMRVLTAHHVDEAGQVRTIERGLDAMCCRNDLLTLKAAHLRRDLLETRFFGAIDQAGARAMDRLMQDGPNALTAEERCDFARLLMSPEARRPEMVARIRDEGGRFLEGSLDNDPEIAVALAKHGIAGKASDYYQGITGVPLEDRALLIVQRLVDNPEVGGRLINAVCDLIAIPGGSGTLLLGDRPLIRVGGFDDPGACWIMPLAPHALFVAANHSSVLRRLRDVSPRRLRKQANVSTARQADRFVFAADASDPQWLGRHLGKARSAPKGASPRFR